MTSKKSTVTKDRQTKGPAASVASAGPQKVKKALLMETREKAFLEIFSALGSTMRLDLLLKRLLNFTLKECKANQGSILLIDDATHRLKMLASKGLPKKVQEEGHLERKEGIAEWVITHNKPMILNDAVDDPRFKSVVRSRSLRSAMCVPLKAKGKVIGTININRTNNTTYFDDNDLNMAVIMASQAAVAIDNTRLYEENIQAERLAAIGQTVSGISHCIKNILTGVKGGISLCELAIRSKSWEGVDDGWDMLKRNVNRIALLMMDMLDYSKERKPNRQNVNLEKLVDDVFGLMQHNAEEVGVILEKKIMSKELVLNIDGDQIFRSLLNLVGNGIDAMPNGGTLMVFAREVYEEEKGTLSKRVKASDRLFALEVADEGIGIGPEDIKNIFLPFFSTKGSKGTGIGLAVTKKIVEEHGGELHVSSAPGKGTVFTMYLPHISESNAQPHHITSSRGVFVE